MSALPPAFPAKAKNVIFLRMVGGPSQLDLFDDKPELADVDGPAQPMMHNDNARAAAR